MKRATMIWILALAIAGQLALSGCGGGGGGSQPAASSQTQQPASTTANIAGKVVITGVDNYTGVVVVAEKTSSGVTARVQSQLDAAEADPAARISARQALDTPGVYTTETDSAGNYEFENIPPGKYSISAYKESTLAAQPRIVEATAGQAVTVDFELVATGSITGAVTLSGAATGNSGTLVFIPGTSYSAYANDAGAFTMTNVPVGTYTLTFARDGYTWSSTTGVTVSAGASASVAAVSLSPTTGGLPGTIVCNSNNDCDDSNNYTEDVCNDRGLASSSCSNIAILCIYSADCDDGNGLTTDICNNAGSSAASCTNAVIACLNDSMCNDNDAYTVDSCVNPATSSSYCAQAAIACITDADCNDNNPLTTDTCSNPGTSSSACSNPNTPPAAVSLNPAASVTDTSLILSWSMSPDTDFQSYKVYRDSTLVTTITTKATTNTTVTGLAQNTTYSFTVHACDTAGACTASNQVSATTAPVAGTYVSGIIWGDTTWALANSPYVINSLVQIPSGVTLTIEPGVNVIYTGVPSNIEVHGAIIANGTAGNEIVFRSVADGTNSGATMIRIKGDANASLSQFDYIIMKWGGNGIALENAGGTLTISNSTFTNNAFTGGGIFNNSGPSALAVSNSTFSFNDSDSIFTQCSLTVSNSTFSFNGRAINAKGSLTVSNSIFSNNSAGSGGAILHEQAAIINDSTFSNNSAGSGGAIYSSSFSITSTTVSNTTFSNNSASTGAGGAIFGMNVTLSNSTITSTTGAGQGIYVSSTADITYTEITGYAIGVLNSGAITAFHHNNVYGNTQYQFKNQRPNASGDISLGNNWWGTTDLSAAPNLPFIYDYNDNLNYSAVDVTPILTSPELTAGDPD